ncbi:MAG: endolytic transglycosylase MltG [Actinomycetota bacterium]
MSTPTLRRPPRPRGEGLSRSSRRFLATIGALLVLAIGGIFALTSDPGPDVEAGLEVTYEVEPGASVRAVGEDLESLGVIDSAFAFRTAGDRTGLAGVLQPGTFTLVTGMTIDEAIAALAAGPERAVQAEGERFTVQEGLTVDDTLARIAEQLDHLTVEELRSVLDERLEQGPGEGRLVVPDAVPEPGSRSGTVEPWEGYLWPQTYEVPLDAPADVVLQTMLDQLGGELARVTPVASPWSEGRAWALLTVASLIERETQIDAERVVVAGVMANRLRDGMRLEIDATLSYAKGDLSAIPLDADRDIDSPFNTYRNDGLPPGPISGVGRASLEAAAAPGATTALFYVLAPECDGTHRFADSFEEHTRNVAEFRRARDAGACG